MSNTGGSGKGKKTVRLVLAAVLIVALVLLLILGIHLILRLTRTPEAPGAPAPAGTPAAAAQAPAEPTPEAANGQGDPRPEETPAPEDAEETAAEGGELSLEEYLGVWEDVSEPLNTARLSLHENGEYWLYAGFYRLVGFDAVYRGERDGDGRLIFRAEDADIVCCLLLKDDGFTLVVEVPEEYSYSPSFSRANEYEYRRVVVGDTDWLGVWKSDGGETLEIYEQRADCILLNYTGLTASGESSFTSRYTLYFEDRGGLIAGEEKSVEQAAGWRYRLELDGDVIIMYSRYPDRLFYRQS